MRSVIPTCCIFMTVVSALCGAASAKDTCYETSKSHVDESNCEWAIANRTHREMMEKLRDLLIKSSSLKTQSGEVIFNDRIETDQNQWEKWAKSHCSLEGDITMGTAAITDEPLCRQRLDLERAKTLETMTQQLP